MALLICLDVLDETIIGEMETKMDMEHLSDYGDSAYYLRNDGAVMWKSNSGWEYRLVYESTPIKAGYQEYMDCNLFNALDDKGLIDWE